MLSLSNDTRPTALVAQSPASQDKKFFDAPLGPLSLGELLEAARAVTPASSFLTVSLPVDSVFGSVAAASLWAIDDYEIAGENGKRFWSDNHTPIVARLKVPGPVQTWPLLFVVREGQEVADYAALVEQVKRNGLAFDAPLRQVVVPAGEKGRGQFVAILPKEKGA